MAALGQQQFDAIHALVKYGRRQDVLRVRDSTYRALKRAGLARDPGKAPKRDPSAAPASVASAVAWIDSVDARDLPAMRQVQQIDAVCVARG